MPKFLVEYEHDGDVWAVEMFAEDFTDAERRVRALAEATLKGEIHERIELPQGRQLHLVK